MGLLPSWRMMYWRESEPPIAAMMELEFLDASDGWWYFRSDGTTTYLLFLKLRGNGREREELELLDASDG